MSLSAAIAAFIQTGCDRTKMSVPAWAITFNCGVEEIRAEWEAQMTVKSQVPDNAFDCEGK